MAKKKNNTKIEKEHMNAVAEIGCIVCRQNGFYGTPSEIHHIRQGAGMGQRSTNFQVIPLCPIHHRAGGHGEVGFHQSPKEFAERYGTEQMFLDRVNEILGLVIT